MRTRHYSLSVLRRRPNEAHFTATHNKQMRLSRTGYARFNDLTYVDSPSFIGREPGEYIVELKVIGWGSGLIHRRIHVASAQFSTIDGVPASINRHYA